MNIAPLLASCPCLYIAAAIGVLMVIYALIRLFTNVRQRYTEWMRLRNTFMAIPKDARVKVIENYREASPSEEADYDGLPIELAAYFRKTQTRKPAVIAELIEWHTRALIKEPPPLPTE